MLHRRSLLILLRPFADHRLGASRCSIWVESGGLARSNKLLSPETRAITLEDPAAWLWHASCNGILLLRGVLLSGWTRK